ncbi:MAG TPA: hypothetical protein DEF42_00100 [Desulfosporosinus sp.]|nr:hypothetical protein [Desulfosporosinus sp.]
MAKLKRYFPWIFTLTIFIVLLTPTLSHAYVDPTKPYKIILKNLQCLDTLDTFSEDEVYLDVFLDGEIATDLTNRTSTININTNEIYYFTGSNAYERPFKDSAFLKLFAVDPVLDIFIDNLTVFPELGLGDQVESLYTNDILKGNATYNLVYEVVSNEISDTEAPVWPEGSVLTSSNITETTIDLTWTPATDNVRVSSYLLSINGLTDIIIPGNITQYQVKNLTPGQAYTFYLYARDADNNGTSMPIYRTDSTLALDTLAPGWPAGSVLRSDNRTETSLDLSWTPATDNREVSTYSLKQNDTQIATIAGDTTMYHVDGLAPNTMYTFKIDAIDPAGNLSTTGPSVEASTDITPPYWSTGAALTFTKSSSTSLDLSWGKAVDNGLGLSGYKVIQNSTLIDTIPPLYESTINDPISGQPRKVLLPNTFYSVEGLDPRTTQTFSVVAIDAAGNETSPLNVTVATDLYGSITGKVTASGQGTPGAVVILFEANDPEVEVKSAVTDANGNYTLSDLNPGTYILKFEYDAPWEETLEQWYLQTTGYDTASPLTVTNGGVLSSIDADFEIYGSISGIVRDLSGSPLTGVTVEVYKASNNALVTTTSTDSTGNYTVENLLPERYNVSFLKSNYPMVWYNQRSKPSEADYIDILPGDALTQINANLYIGGNVFGHVTNQAGLPLQGMTVTIYDDDYYDFSSTSTDSNGNYSLSDLPPGQYKLEISKENELDFMPWWYGDAEDYVSAAWLTFSGRGSQAENEYEVNAVIHLDPSVDTVKPVITLNGLPEITLQVGSTYIDAGATAEDNVDGDLTDELIVTNPIDTAQVGTYTIRYNVIDAYGNQAEEVVRTVHIVSAAYTAEALIQMGIRPNGDDAGLYIGLENVVGPDGNPVENFKLSGYQVEISYDPTKVSLLEALDIAKLGQFEQNNLSAGKVFVVDASTSSTENMEQLFFLPLVLKGSALDLASLEIHFSMVRDQTLNIVNVPKTNLSFIRGKILNEAGLNHNVGDAVAGLQYIANLRTLGFEDLQVNLINMAAIVEDDPGIAVPNVKDIIALLQYLVEKRDPSFSVIE